MSEETQLANSLVALYEQRQDLLNKLHEAEREIGVLRADVVAAANEANDARYEREQMELLLSATERERDEWKEIGARSEARARRWKRAAKHWHMIGNGAQDALRMAFQDARVLQDAISEIQDARPIAGDAEIQECIADLRGRLDVQMMYTVDLEHQLARARATSDAQREALELEKGRLLATRAAADQAISNLRAIVALNDDPHIDEIARATADLLGGLG